MKYKVTGLDTGVETLQDDKSVRYWICFALGLVDSPNLGGLDPYQWNQAGERIVHLDEGQTIIGKKIKIERIT